MALTVTWFAQDVTLQRDRKPTLRDSGGVKEKVTEHFTVSRVNRLLLAESDRGGLNSLTTDREL